MKERILKIMRFYNLNQRQFAKKIDVTPQTIGDILRGKRQAGSKVISGISQNIKELNMVWLMKGEGEMMEGGINHSNSSTEEIEAINELKSKKLVFNNHEELALYCINHEDELLKSKVFMNLIEKHSALMALKLINKMNES